MNAIARPWDYLIVTASNAAQAAAYEAQLRVRQDLGLLVGARQVLVVADPPGLRIGSGGSTVRCLCEVLRRELPAGRSRPEDWQEVLCRLRILIVHAGGDSRRLPAYGPCGKIFIPVPGKSDSAIPTTLFDRQIPIYLALPPAPPGAGQVVITAGDVLLTFDPAHVRFAGAGITGLGSHAPPEQASKHGVYCMNGPGGRVRLYLQKPSPHEQAAARAIDRYGQSVLDIGVIGFDAPTAVALLSASGVTAAGDGSLGWGGAAGAAIETLGLDFYREICCALGKDATAAHHLATARASGSKWDDALLAGLFAALSPIPLTAQVLPHCGFLHFGTTRQVIGGGLELLRADRGVAQPHTVLNINSAVADDAGLVGHDAWVEGCRVTASLRLGGANAVVGVDVDRPLELPAGASLDVLAGKTRDGRPAWFVRCYGTRDSFKEPLDAGATFCGRPMAQWLQQAGATADDVWPADVPEGQRTLWNARVFPAAASPADYAQWLWMFDPAAAEPAERKAWRAGDRYSAAEIADLTDHAAFHERRAALRAVEVGRSLRRLFRLRSRFSAADLAHVLRRSADPAETLRHMLDEAMWHHREAGESAGMGAFVFSRIIHSVGSAVERLTDKEDGEAPSEPRCAAGFGLHVQAEACTTIQDALRRMEGLLSPAERTWLAELGLLPSALASPAEWAARARAAAFDYLGRTIVSSSADRPHPRHRLRSDEIVWGRAPARLDLGGGWSDTPPYSLEHGGSVINAAVDLNGQPPIHCYGRIIPERVIRIGSIDLGTRIEIRNLETLLDYCQAGSEYGLVKAALALSGFSPEMAAWPAGAELTRMLELFGGGIELTTLAAVPKGSGLGTSSIMGAVVLAVIRRMMGQPSAQRELFHGVLRLEQALTTGGGWQDQIGGVVDLVKVVTTEPGLVPDARLHYVPADVLDPQANGGATLLYYTGVTRLAKNILQQVVGRYLDRDRAAMATLEQIHALPPHVADAMARKDLGAFGELIDVAWRLNKQLDPNSSTPEIEAMLDRARPHLYGAKLLGAGGGGFLLMVCRSGRDAERVRELLEADPPNPRARFFQFSLSRTGLAVNVC